MLPNCVFVGAMTCADAVCQNGATCANVTGGGVKCKCSVGYAGKYCERTYVLPLSLVYVIVHPPRDFFRAKTLF